MRYLRTRTTGGVYADRFEYVYRDHLGSIDKITDSAGNFLHTPTHDPFGGRRQGNWLSDIPPVNNILTWDDERFYRGFTDHEELNRTGFIHMNGRVYDPRIGRFVSPDPVVQDPTNSQSYNRYSYVLNSPLSYTDPSGFSPGDGPPDLTLPNGIEVISVTGQRDAGPGLTNPGGFDAVFGTPTWFARLICRAPAHIIQGVSPTLFLSHPRWRNRLSVSSH